MRRLVLSVLPLMAPLMLGGCGLPPAISVVAYLIDGATFIGTGKTMSDHALSAVAQEDCVLWRVVKGELVCQGPGEKGEKSALALAAADTVYPGYPDEDVAPAPHNAAPDPAATLQLAALAPQAGGSPAWTAPEPGRSGWEPVLTLGEAAVAAGGRGWPIAAATPAPVVAGPAGARARAGTGLSDPAMIRAHRRLLEFRAPIELLAQRSGAEG